MKKYFLLLLVFTAIWTPQFAQQRIPLPEKADVTKDITLEGIWKNYTYYARGVRGFNFLNDGKSYTRLESGKVQQYDFLTSDLVGTLFDSESLQEKINYSDYTFSDAEDKMLLTTESESIYRYSSRANYYVWDRQSDELEPLFDEGKQMYATFNPSADKVAFVYQNDLYIRDLMSGKVTRVTSDGDYNNIINGATDWVYEEEFALVRAFEWSPDGTKIAFLRFDESEVKEFMMQLYKDELYPENVTFKYPKVGEKNAIVSAHVYDLSNGKLVKIETGDQADQYLPRIQWTPNGELCVFRMNRHQSQLDLLIADTATGKTKTLYTEKEDAYVAQGILDNISFLQDGKHFVMTSERDGYHHLYLHNMKTGKQMKQLTSGDWDITNFYGIDEANQMAYYQAAKASPMRKHVYSVDLKGKSTQLTKEEGTNNATFSNTFDYFILNHSTINTAPTYGIYDRKGKLIRALEDNKRISNLQEEYSTAPMEFFEFTTADNVQLNGWMLKPADFDESKEYPVFMYLYGGPGSQQVTDGWKGQNYWWFQMLAQQGFIVACVDNRGTGARGEDFKKVTYLQLGHYETIDQIAAAEYLGGLSYTDKDRIGIFGWSYGGYMSSLCLLKGNDVFKAAIAVAPVTSWKWYDTIYTERFMRTLAENEDGYKNNSPVYFANQLKGNYLLAHGIADDNVHYQHAVEMSNALISANKQFDTYAYPNRNHGIYGDNARLHLYTKMTNFLTDKLMNDDSPVGGETRP
ncbi:MAG: S9 family peptidase [Bacteroidota bacterium]